MAEKEKLAIPKPRLRFWTLLSRRAPICRTPSWTTSTGGCSRAESALVDCEGLLVAPFIHCLIFQDIDITLNLHRQQSTASAGEARQVAVGGGVEKKRGTLRYVYPLQFLFSHRNHSLCRGANVPLWPRRASGQYLLCGPHLGSSDRDEPAADLCQAGGPQPPRAGPIGNGPSSAS